ncbi:MAG: hypothetical protein NVSMB64_11000 [Candidatus Velthaea sp.]
MNLCQENGRATVPLENGLRKTPNIIVIDEAMHVILTGATDVWLSAGVEPRVGAELPGTLAAIVAATLEEWKDAPPLIHAALVFPWPEVAVTIYPVDVAGGRHICLSAERFRARRDLRWAERSFGFSRREAEILRHVLRGAATPQIAGNLNIAESTVIAHIKSLLLKTKAANRAALVARVLGWQDSTP